MLATTACLVFSIIQRDREAYWNRPAIWSAHGSDQLFRTRQSWPPQSFMCGYLRRPISEEEAKHSLRPSTRTLDQETLCTPLEFFVRATPPCPTVSICHHWHGEPLRRPASQPASHSTTRERRRALAHILPGAFLLVYMCSRAT